MHLLSNTLWQASALFVVSLVLFHIYVFLAKPNSRFLKMIDYWWLAFAALSLVSATSAQRRMIADNQIELSGRRVETNLREVRYFVRSAQTYACDTGWQPPPFPDQKGQQRYDTRQAACSWFTELNRQAQHSDLMLRDVLQILSRDLPPSLPSSWEYEPLSHSVANAKRVLDHDLLLRADAQQDASERLLVFFTPYLLAIALALRVTKVTGELRL